jgi:hypothetical protein
VGGRGGLVRRFGLYLTHGAVGAGMIRRANAREELALWAEMHRPITFPRNRRRPRRLRRSYPPPTRTRTAAIPEDLGRLLSQIHNTRGRVLRVGSLRTARRRIGLGINKATVSGC